MGKSKVQNESIIKLFAVFVVYLLDGLGMVLDDVAQLGQVGVDELLSLGWVEKVREDGSEEGADVLGELDVIALLGFADYARRWLLLLTDLHLLHCCNRVNLLNKQHYLILRHLRVVNQIVLPMQPIQQAGSLLHQHLLSQKSRTDHFFDKGVSDQSGTALRIAHQPCPLLI